MTVLVTRRVKAGREREFDAFLQRLKEEAASYPGHQGATIIPPPASSREYVIVYRFDSADHLRAWRTSPVRQLLIAESADLAEAPAEERELSGMETWFAVPGGQVVRPPARWKTWLLSLLAIYPLLTVMVIVAQPLLNYLPLAARFAVITPVLTALMTWIAMPVLSRLFARWLYQ
ncbi:MAG: antibiotic biosynthesis monooxygenase [Actinomycetota bacterium]|nr:antibiotic biosynthesis monooxygenase [Actinomycetota bacterium]